MQQPNPSPVALITGAARRVGRAIALRLADAGFDIAFTYLSSITDAQTLTTEIQGKSRRCLAISADLTDPATATETIGQKFTESFDRLNVLVNNASLYAPSALDQTDLPQMRRFWSIHVESPLLLCRAFAPTLRKNSGHIINMVDLLAERPWPQYLSYCTSKAGLWNLTLGLARELAPEVTVNGIAPGVAEWAPGTSEDEKKNYLKRVPLNRAGTPTDIAEAIHYLCTTGSYITGQILRVDGGRSIT
ncbi:MAG: SDR family oxidoreductase [Tepidisphaeraceae bacterium]|jgi:pteridine reductase